MRAHPVLGRCRRLPRPNLTKLDRLPLPASDTVLYRVGGLDLPNTLLISVLTTR
ncbi:uncharacterized protein PHALS_04004 [Plasmopara halstedii]|uniref:Uncharacterized protein n=1 Tax=Plasmopara halstedii TaxID=4781 RepID=A0A0P1A8G0_PLAHL|nr:uncharacterized protein PHALS_04004 [Plasmopara halstedii]CEG36754.1 hypothetical protein PHALS_04004 [Plasmopara halstedii]|eukprot:XP_024573123.1 hypothetical protein PHALS_04004 [Plasmopara halstedii]